MEKEKQDILQNGKPFLTTSEIITLSGKHANTVYSWIKHSKIKPVDKISNSYIFNKQNIVDFLHDNYSIEL